MSTIISIILSDFKHYKAISLKQKLICYFFNTSFRLLLNYQMIQFFKKHNIPILSVIYSKKQKRKYSCEISSNAKLGKNISFPHPFGIVIGGDTLIGDNVTIFQQVTFGSHGKKGQKKEYPIIEDNAIIYAGAKIIGGIIIGKNSIIGANSVVTRNVPENSTAVGVPAKIIYAKAE